MLDHLTAAGTMLFGPRWQSEIARALGTTDRSIRRWIADDSVPDEIVPKLRKQIDQRIKALKRVRQRLPG
jgi:predicted transcriptional regulator